jgi:hypothetical protein
VNDVNQLSVCVAARNAETWLDEALTSLYRDQPYVTFELIVVNHGSTDQTGEILARWASGRPGMRVIDLPWVEGQGPAVAKNRAIREASCDIVRLFDADDILPPGALEEGLMQLLTRDVDGVFGNYITFDGQQETRIAGMNPTLSNYVNAVQNYIQPGTITLYKRVFERGAYFNESHPCREDRPWVCERLHEGFRLAYVPRDWLRYRISAGTNSRTDASFQYEERVVTPYCQQLLTTPQVVIEGDPESIERTQQAVVGSSLRIGWSGRAPLQIWLPPGSTVTQEGVDQLWKLTRSHPGQTVVARLLDPEAGPVEGVKAAWKGSLETPTLHVSAVVGGVSRHATSLTKTHRLGVVVLCHTAYLSFLPECLASIDNQSPAADRKLLVLDGCDLPPWVPTTGWEVICGKWGSPNPGRNLGLAQLDTEWVVFFDADNVMPQGYLQGCATSVALAPIHCGILYPAIHYYTADLSQHRVKEMPPVLDYWALRQRNRVDTSACWRRQAVVDAGGFDETISAADDYTLALRVTRDGWTARQLTGPAICMREHSLGRRSVVGAEDPWQTCEALWKARSHAIVTLLAGRELVFDRWANWLNTAYLPPWTHLYLGNNSEWSAQRILDALDLSRFQGVTLIPLAGRPGSDWAAVQQHVAGLYRQVLPRVEEDMILTLEDDIEPSEQSAVRLYEAFPANSSIGAAGALYESPTGGACLSYQLDEWGECPPLADVRAQPQVHDVGFIGGGFTWYAGWALRQALPIGERIERRQLGWDGLLAERLRANGCRVVVNVGVEVTHHLHGVIRT